MQKFIVTAEGRFKFGDVVMHRELLDRGEECIGGGVYEFDYVNKKMLLSGKSYDYGRVKWGYIDQLILPESLKGFDIEYEDLPITAFAKVVF